MKFLLRLFSWIFHPIFIPVFGMACYFLLSENYLVFEQKILMVIQVSIVTIFIPMCIFYLLKTIGKADSVMLSDLSQRKIPLFVQSALLLILISKSIRVDVAPELFYFLAGGLISSAIAFTLLYTRTKASLHMLGMASLLAFSIGLSMHFQVNAIYIISILIFTTGAVATSRLFMNAHNSKELTIGFFAGLLPQIALWYLWL